MIELAKLCFAESPDIDVQVGMVPEHEDVALTMTTHRLVVVSGQIKAKAIDEAEVLREIALVIPRHMCVGDRPTAGGLLKMGSEALVQAMARHPGAKALELFIDTVQGVKHALLKVSNRAAA